MTASPDAVATTTSDSCLAPAVVADSIGLVPGRWRASSAPRRPRRPALAFGPPEAGGPTSQQVAVRHRRWLRVAIGLAAVGIAYHPSVTATIDGVGRGEARFALVVLPVALALAIARGRSARREPNIHDRQLDYLVGLPLLVGAWFVLVVMPHRVPGRYWDVRIDVLSFPFFVAGLVAILFGVRALWRWRASVVLLFACWPPLYDGIPVAWRRGEAGLGRLAVERAMDAPPPTGQALTGATLLCVVGLVAITLALASRPRLRHGLVWLVLIGVVTLVLDAARALVVGGIDAADAGPPLDAVRALLPVSVLALCLALVFASRQAIRPLRPRAPRNRRPDRRSAGPLLPAAVWSLALAVACVLAPAPETLPAANGSSETASCCP